jgi:hypothetical protein
VGRTLLSAAFDFELIVEAGVTHSLTNVGRTDAKFVTLEFQ